MKTYFLLVIASVLFASCFNVKAKLNGFKSLDSLTMDSIVADTSKILIAELPINFDKTDYLIHPIGLVSLNDYSSKRWTKNNTSSGNDFSSTFLTENDDLDYVSGTITNLVFENTKTAKQQLLTNKVINITYFEYLRELTKKISRQYIIYYVIDNDYNNDKRLDNYDIISLYISKIDGSDFTKITNDGDEFESGKLILHQTRYYFRTIEDDNKDGIFNEFDKYHYYYIDFSVNPYKVVEYNPMGLITKEEN